MPRIAYVNGRYVPHHMASVHIEDRGFQFADGAYEVVALVNGRFADTRGHLDRLERSLSELQIPMPVSRSALQIIMREIVRLNRIANASLYIQVSRGQAPRDFKFPDNVAPTLVMTLRPANLDVAVRKRTHKKAITVPDIRWKRRDIKSTALLPQVLAKQKAIDSGAYEAWMVDDEGYITEGASSNAWIVTQDGKLLTRATDGNMILKGVTRNALQALCREEGIDLVERAFTPAEAYEAKEAFITAATALIVPIVEIDGHIIGTGECGDLTARILDLYMAYAQNEEKEQKAWTPQ